MCLAADGLAGGCPLVLAKQKTLVDVPVKKASLALVTSVLFSGSYIAGKYTTNDLEPLTTTWLRYVVALLLLTLMLAHFGTRVLHVALRHVPGLVLLGLSGIVGYHYFFYLSLRYTEVANTAIVNALSPVVTGVLAASFLGERLSKRNYAGILLTVVGVVILLSRGEAERLIHSEYNRGDLFMLLAVVCWAVYALLVRRLIGAYSGFTLTFYATLFGVLLLCLMVPIESPLEQILAISWASLLSLLYMGVFASGLGYYTYNLSIDAIGATRTSGVVYSLVPIFVALLAIAFFGEAISFVMVSSAVLVLLGLHLMLSGRDTAGSR